jgi:hypothetical protein
MPSRSIDLLQEWDTKPRDGRLFREVIDKVIVAFRSYPNEHRHIAFLTNKWGCEEIEKMIQLDELKEQALEIGTRIIPKKNIGI